MKKIFIVFFLVLELQLMAQDPCSSQFFFNPLYLNPAFAGFNKNARIGTDYRNQWTAIPSKFVTYNCWGDIYTPLFGFGFIAMKDVSGEGFLKTTSIGVIQSYEILIPKVIRIRTGYNITIANKRIDWNKLVFSDQLDGLQGQVYNSSATPGNAEGKTYADFTAGVILDLPKIKTIKKFTITNTCGLTVNHLTEPNDGLSGSTGAALPFKSTIHYTMVVEILKDRISKSSFFVSPNFVYEKQGRFTTTNVGFYVSKKPMIGGFFYRKRTIADMKDDDSFIVFMGMHKAVNKEFGFRIGYSYDFTLNELAANALGSHEISIVAEFNNIKLFNKSENIRKRNKKIADCTDFGPSRDYKGF